MTKTLQQIKDDVAKEYMEYDFNSCYNRDNVSESMIDQIAIRYAQEQNKELVEMLRYLDRVGGLGHDTHERIDKLINKYKQG